jgi:hypothetical protein
MPKKDSSITFAVEKEEKKYDGPTTDVFLPELEGGGMDGMKVDQYEHVTIANEDGEQIWHVHRGEHVEVPVPVFIVLKDRYPKL